MTEQYTFENIGLYQDGLIELDIWVGEDGYYWGLGSWEGDVEEKIPEYLWNALKRFYKESNKKGDH